MEKETKELQDFAFNCMIITAIAFFLLIMSSLTMNNNDQINTNAVETSIELPHKENYAVDITDAKRKYLDHLFNTKE